jgi:hypothetical protein
MIKEVKGDSADKYVLFTQWVIRIRQRFLNCGARLPGALLILWGASCLYEGQFILKEMWAQHKTYILTGTLFGRRILLTT